MVFLITKVEKIMPKSNNNFINSRSVVEIKIKNDAMS